MVERPLKTLATGMLVVIAGMACAPRDQVVASLLDAGGATDVTSGGGFGAPVSVAGLLDDGELIQDPTLSLDELDIYFAATKAGTYDIWHSRRTAIDQPWGPASVVAELSTANDDLEPDLASDGLTMYLASDRPGGTPGFYLWVSHRATTGDVWGVPEPLKLGDSSTDRSPTIDVPQVTLVFHSRYTNEFDLYRSSRATPGDPWGAPVPLTEVNSVWFDWDPALFLDGRGLVFASRRDGDHGSSDLYEARASAAMGRFSAPVPLADLNAPSSEGDPWLSNNGRHIVFSSDRSGVSRLYEAWR